MQARDPSVCLAPLRPRHLAVGLAEFLLQQRDLPPGFAGEWPVGQAAQMLKGRGDAVLS
ncbi:hypothetical protein [Streptomyces sp. SID12488]|uniref:hypothetical protein n=1 Tax=Streptomyces sp. SID12488 TaxID=2706040 RepID=UPI0013DCEAE7|nr:hypothetical protein [Streptomyces sp. SID12488]NEA67479.1 hypothetical protein [Streptomyces sp. SID12488]